MKTFKKSLCLSAIVLTAIFMCMQQPAFAQIKIGDNSTSINANSLFEMETTNMGLLPPRVALNSNTSAVPLTAPVPEGMTVYSIGGTLANGYYFWNGSRWIPLLTGDYNANIVTKTANCTLLKTETMVLASNDITVTLPVVTAADNGLCITVKNNGSFVDLIIVIGSGGALIDSGSNFYLPRYLAGTFVAYNGAWVVSDKHSKSTLFDVGPNCSWTSVEQIVAFLNVHMLAPTVVRLSDSLFSITETQVIDLPFPVTFQAASYGSTTVGPASGLAGMPMFVCKSECYFKMIMFDASTLAGYGTSDGEDAIHIEGVSTYHEIKDCTFEGFYNAVVSSSNAELWLFECDIYNANKSGVLLNSITAGAKLRISETDFIDCRVGVNLDKGSNIIVQLALGAYDNVNATDTSIRYNSASCTFSKMQITDNAWNNIGVFITGFDFTRSDGRDANAYIQSNAGVADAIPTCKINVRDNATATTITTAGTYYKAAWVNTTSLTSKWRIENNKITYLPENKRTAVLFITGNISCNNSNRVVTLGIVKKGVTSTRYGECNQRITTANQPFMFATVIQLEDVAKNDYFELYCTSSTNGDLVTFQDVQWFTETR